MQAYGHRYYSYMLCTQTLTLCIYIRAQVTLHGYKLSFLWIGDETDEPWTPPPRVDKPPDVHFDVYRDGILLSPTCHVPVTFMSRW